MTPPTIRRVVCVSSSLLALVILCLVGFAVALLDWRMRPMCHKQIMLSLMQWEQDHGRGRGGYPNEGGRSRESLSVLREMLAVPTVESTYRYVAGLRPDDPGDLVLLYLAQPTRWIWHGRPRTRLVPKGWIVVPVDFALSSTRTVAVPGECSEWLPGKAFAERLRSTLDFVRTNQRPNWQTVIAEHAPVLEALERHAD